MDLYSTTIISIISSSICFLLLKVYNYFKLVHKLKVVPGFKSYPFLGDLLLLSGSVKPGFPQNIVLQQAVLGCKLIFTNAPLLKLWISVSPYVFLLTAEAAEDLLSSHKEITKSKEYKNVRTWLGEGLLTSTALKWKKRRRMLTPTFHFRVLEDFQKVINEQSLSLVNHLMKETNNESVDILKFITNCTLDIICETAMGVKLDAQVNTDSSYLKCIDTLGDILIDRTLNPLLWHDSMFNRSAKGKQFNEALEIVLGFTKKVIRQRINSMESSPEEAKKDVEKEFSQKKRLAFLDLLIDEHKNNPDFTESDIQEEVDTFMFEGHDTTAVGLSWCIFLLGHHPEIQELINEELIQIFGDVKYNHITEKDLKELKYLECVIKESQRMYPSVPFIGRELEDDMLIAKYLIPKGTSCLVSIAAIHRDPNVFPEPHIFDPERFTVEKSSGRHPYGYIPFSAGPRNCIGQKFAMNEEKTVMANLVRNFKWTSLDAMDKVTFAPHMVSRPVPGHRIKLTTRK